jgi:hypothetical protein
VLVPDTVVELLPVGETVGAVATFSSMVMGELVELDALVLVVEAFDEPVSLVLVVEILVVDVVVVPTIFHTMSKNKCENRTTYMLLRKERY